MNHLYLGDCLNVLRDNVKDESIDLIYIDPPFNSKRNYNVFFDDKEIQTQRVAFEDTWSLKSIGDSLLELHTVPNEKLYKLLRVYQEAAPHVFPYLVMMSLRILELHRVLKSTGSFYLHCDPTASHYLKTVCDLIFGVKNFRNEIIWHYSGWNAKLKSSFSSRHDIILFYTKQTKPNFNSFAIGWESEEEYIKLRRQKVRQDENGKKYVLSDAGGGKRVKRFLDEAMSYGKPVDDVWDLDKINNSSKEALGYPTQKPKSLLERVIQANSNEGDIVLDAFCGCGTTIDTAEGLNRQWIGIDISSIAINVIKHRLKDSYKKELTPFEIRGVPSDEASAIKLWEHNPFVFEDWWLTEFDVFATTFAKKGADKGIDGIGMYAIPGAVDSIKAAFQVKGGKVQSKDIDALLSAMTKHKCELGVLLTKNTPTKPMLETVVQAGHFAIACFTYPKLQMMTLAEFFKGKQLTLPKSNITFKRAKTLGKGGEQKGLF